MRETTRAWRSDFGSFIVDRRGTILGFDEAMERLTGWPAVEVVGRCKDLGPGETLQGDTGLTDVPPLYAGEIPMVAGTKSLDLTLYGRDGRQLDVEALAKRLAGPGERILVTVLRVLARSALIGVSDDLRLRDPLTGLPGREAFERQLAEDTRNAMATGRPLALILVDVDHLHEVNERLGQEAGDEVLQHLGGILRVTVDDEHRLYRLDDDDFAVLLTDAGRGEARQVASTLRSTVERYRLFPHTMGESKTRITLSLGAASLPTDAETDGDLLERATEALNEARSMGRNRVWCYLRRPRVPLQVPVFFDGAEDLLVGYTRDLSPSGIFVQTAAPIDIGMRCALTFPLPGMDGQIHVIGRVVRTVPPDMSVETREVRIPGMGVEFERFERSSDRRAIDSYLHGHEAQTLRPETGALSLGRE